MDPNNDNQPASTGSDPQQPDNEVRPDNSNPPLPQPESVTPPPESGPEPSVGTAPVVSSNIADVITPSNQTTPAVQTPEQGVVTPTPPPVVTRPQNKNHKRAWRLAAIVFAAVIVLAGGAAAAFFTVYLPRQPWYILDTALKNSMSQTSLTTNITSNVSSSGSSGLSFKAAVLLAANLDAKTVDTKLNLEVAGTSIPIELRLVNSNLYFEFGDLSSLSSLLKLAGANYSAIVDPLLPVLSNHWFEVDSTLLDQNKDLRCFLNDSWTLSSSDSNYLVNSYMKKPFLKVQSTSTATVDSVASDKLNVLMNNNEAASYIQGFTNLQSFKSLDQCTGGSSSAFSTKQLANGKTTPLTIWVDKSTHRINQIEYNVPSGKSYAGAVTASLNYAPVNVQAPSGAVPLTQLLSELEQQLKTSPQLETALGSALLSL